MEWIRSRRSQALAGVVTLVVAVVALMLLGSKAPSVLSTVGSPIGGGQPGTAAGPDVGPPSEDAAGGGNTRGPGGTGSGGGDAGTVILAAERPDLLIIKTGNLQLQVTDLDAALAAATSRIGDLGGYASGSQRSGDGDAAIASVTFRVPADRWDEALSALRALATKVVVEQTSTEDVTGQVVDLGARITNLQATEHALQAIMDRATEIKDVLAVQQQLTDVRGQIEQLSAQRAHLQEQAAYSTLDASFSLKPDPVLTSKAQFDPADEADHAAAQLVSVLQAVATAGIWFAIVWLPILLALLVVAGVAFFVLRRLGGRGATGGPMGGSGGSAEATPAGS